MSCYLELAMRQGLPLAIRDKLLSEACKKSGAKLINYSAASGGEFNPKNRLK